MFYSNGKINNANSIFPPLPPYFSLYQHQQDLTTNGHDLHPASLSTPPALDTTNSCYNQTVINWNNQVKNSDPFTTNLQYPARKLIKKRPAGDHSTKDRLRKIVTAQGPRDRRVRLSIQIARKFFDLQDTLGFDKPSKTLDWLLTKSKTAIDELALVKATASCSLTTSSTVDHDEDKDTRQWKRNKAWMSSTEKRISRRQQQNITGFGDFARESRAKARERARERTKEKRSSKRLNIIESKQLLLPHCVPSIQPDHSTTWNQIMSTPYFNADHTIHQFTTNSLLNVSNSKLYSDSPRAPENWDISQSFTLVNPSTADLQNCNKLGEIYSYQVMLS